MKSKFRSFSFACSQRNGILDVNVITSLCIQTIIKTLRKVEHLMMLL